METYSLANMTKGWFVGDFNPSVLKEKEFEVAVKRYRKGESEEEHFHAIATEITVIIEGKVIMCGEVFEENSIIKLAPGERTSFEALEDTITVVVKTPSLPSDKYTN